MARLGKKHYCTGDSTYEGHIQVALDGLADGTYLWVRAIALHGKYESRDVIVMGEEVNICLDYLVSSI
jgi:hypothetical protein